MQKIFVYGSLLKDFHNYKKYLSGKVSHIEKATTKGELYSIEGLNYPAMLEGTNDICGQIITLKGDTQAIIKELDSLEQYHGENIITNEYNRILVDVFNQDTVKTEKLPVYIYNTQNPQANLNTLKRIPSGSWEQFCQDSINSNVKTI